jgi:hypothetical protein
MPTLPQSSGNLEQYTDDLCQFLATPLVRQITGGIHVNDSLIHNAWEALPPDWTAWWASLPDHRLAQRDLIASIEEDSRDVPCSRETSSSFSFQHTGRRPESLNNWLGTLKSLSLSRTQRPGLTLSLPQVLTDRMKTKKIAEVSVAAAYIHRVCQVNNITHVIDMGSGQGYLSLTLAFLFPSLRVLAIDGSESQVAGSQASAGSLGISEARLTHLIRYIDGTAPLAVEMESWADGEKCILVGLHACGRLSEHMLRYFTTLPFVTSLAAVGCCYNHLVPISPDCPDGFPISTRLRQRSVLLSPTALMTGCQSPNNWEPTDLSKGPSVYARRHFFRALLEKVFFDKGVHLAYPQEERPAWGIRKGDLASFVTFARRAMHCLDIDENVLSDDELVAYEECYRDYEGKVAILWTLSVLCCKIVESVVAMDRFWFLTEQGADKVDVVPIFDYKISPRNLMMVAITASSNHE